MLQSVGMTTWTIFRGAPEAEEARRAHEASLAAAPVVPTLDHARLRRICLDAGADDVGVVEIERPGLGDEAAHARRIFPRTRSLVTLVTTSNPDAIRSVSRATANLAWHHNHADLDQVTHRVVRALGDAGVRAVATSIGFPMRHEAGQTTWEIAHKVVAVQAGMGHMGVNRNVIHPRLGNFVLLETILIDAVLDRYDQPLDANPCNGCNLCVAACPVGAVRTDDHFDFVACLEHNYREFLFGFEDWVHTIADGDRAGYQAKFTGEETRSMWQSLGFGPNYKSAYCQAVCPAGDDVIGPYLADRAAWRREVLVPLLRKEEAVYVRSGTRAEHVARRNGSKRIRYLDFHPSRSSPENFVLGLRHRFDRGRAVASGAEVRVRFDFGGGLAVVAAVTGGALHLRSSSVLPAVDAVDAVDTVDAPEVRAIDEPVDATVRLLGGHYIRLLHPDDVGAAPGEADDERRSTPTFEVLGDRAALGALLAVLS